VLLAIGVVLWVVERIFTRAAERREHAAVGGGDDRSER